MIFFNISLISSFFHELSVPCSILICRRNKCQINVKVNKFSKTLRSNFLLGILWSLMPCGLLYSALLVAGLTLNILNGTLSMMFFALGTSVSLVISPIILLKIKNGKLWLNETQGMRIAGVLLMIAASWAIWMDLIHPMKSWCQ